MVLLDDLDVVGVHTLLHFLDSLVELRTVADGEEVFQGGGLLILDDGVEVIGTAYSPAVV